VREEEACAVAAVAGVWDGGGVPCVCAVAVKAVVREEAYGLRVQ
jgi:hypothetical protein